ncbi:ATP-dependent Clp protease adaptor ClpS [Fusobacterium animalis]|jgi:hypothetical protein
MSDKNNKKPTGSKTKPTPKRTPVSRVIFINESYNPTENNKNKTKKG